MTPLDRKQMAQTLAITALIVVLIFAAGYVLAVFGLLEAVLTLGWVILVVGGVFAVIFRDAD